MFFDTTAATTSTATSPVIDFHGPDLEEIDYRIVVSGTVSGTSPKIVATLSTSDDNSTFATEKTFPDITGAGETHCKFRSRKRYRKLVLTVSGTNPSFGHIEAGIDSGSRWTRE
jgi:hypothetical protein